MLAVEKLCGSEYVVNPIALLIAPIGSLPKTVPKVGTTVILCPEPSGSTAKSSAWYPDVPSAFCFKETSGENFLRIPVETLLISDLAKGSNILFRLPLLDLESSNISTAPARAFSKFPAECLNVLNALMLNIVDRAAA